MRNWPLFGLRLHTPRLELRIPGLDDLDALADLAAEGVHAPSEMPFAVPWTDAPPEERARSTLQWQWRAWAEWTPENWRCDFVVLMNDQVVATQGLTAHDFAIVREVGTGSWVGRRHQGQGIGTEMRAAVLHLAFEGLGATHAVSSAFTDNPASLAVSRKLGYEPDGIAQRPRRGKPAQELRLRLPRTHWRTTPHPKAEITGLPPASPSSASEPEAITRRTYYSECPILEPTGTSPPVLA